MTVPKTRSSSSKTNRTNRLGFAPHDKNIAGLYRPEQVAAILGNQVRFIAPAQIQRTIIMQFLVLALQDLIGTAKERMNLSKDEVMQKCLQKLAITQKPDRTPAEEQEVAVVTMALFSNVGANQYLLQVIEHCFPDLEHPELLTDEALIEVSRFLFENAGQIED